MNVERPYTIAAPSFVWPGRVGDNCRYLENMVDEVAVIFFETRACLDYTDKDLPPELARLDLSYHVHLPLDLPWTRGAKEVHRLCENLLTKTDFLQPRGVVLHPPQDELELREFIRLWSLTRETRELFLENIKGNDLSAAWPVIRDSGCPVCLDLGHLLAFGQESLLETPGLLEQTRMLHLYAPGPEGEHESLSRLAPHDFHILHHILRHLPASSVIVLEIFHPEKLVESLDIFHSWFTNEGLVFGTRSS
ncbi:MAG: hypothetical protein K9K39_08345 [Desulfohalobiaceae bacterium]|nr:hypothetical protein [Desulfohalobiaceae bacterium]